jgi:quercetin dioxygenase-like cupin family protein
MSGEITMKRSLMVLGTGALLIIVVIAASSLVQVQKAGDKVVYVSSSKAAFKDSPMKGVNQEVVWGDPTKGAHGTFTKFEPGFDGGTHTHTSEVRIVVLKGAYVYKDEAGEKRVGPGDFLLVPGGHKHWSGGDKTEGALFYQEGSAKFDIVPAQ